MTLIRPLQSEESKRTCARGFTLLELLIVVAIILIIIAIAIPDFLKSKMAANQASAVASLRALSTSEYAYASTYNVGYSWTMSELDGTAGTSAAAGMIDSVLAGTGNGSEKSGYTFTYYPCPTSYTPLTAGTPGVGACTTVGTYSFEAGPNGGGVGVYYYTDTPGVIRENSTQPAGPTDSPLGG